MKTASDKFGTYGIRDGSEGPRHDPYAFTEITFTPTDESKPKVTLHGGLGEWIKVGENKIMAEWTVVSAQFTELVGKTPDQVEDLCRRPQYPKLYGKKLTIELTINDIRWAIRGLHLAAGKTKSRVLRFTLHRIADTIGKKACEAYGDHIMFSCDSSIGPDSGSESFACESCGWSEDVTYY